MCTTFKHLNSEKPNFKCSTVKVFVYEASCFTWQIESMPLFLRRTDAFKWSWLGKDNNQYK